MAIMSTKCLIKLKLYFLKNQFSAVITFYLALRTITNSRKAPFNFT